MSFVETYKSFYTQLKSDVDGSSNPFEAAVGSRIFAVQAPAGVSFPFAVYEVDAPTVEPYFSSVEKLETSADVHIFGKAELGVDALLDIEELLFDLLDRKSLAAAAGLDRVNCRSTVRADVGYENSEIIRVTSTFRLIAHRTG